MNPATLPGDALCAQTLLTFTGHLNALVKNLKMHSTPCTGPRTLMHTVFDTQATLPVLPAGLKNEIFVCFDANGEFSIDCLDVFAALSGDNNPEMLSRHLMYNHNSAINVAGRMVALVKETVTDPIRAYLMMDPLRFRLCWVKHTRVHGKYENRGFQPDAIYYSYTPGDALSMLIRSDITDIEVVSSKMREFFEGNSDVLYNDGNGIPLQTGMLDMRICSPCNFKMSTRPNTIVYSLWRMRTRTVPQRKKIRIEDIVVVDVSPPI